MALATRSIVSTSNNEDGGVNERLRSLEESLDQVKRAVQELVTMNQGGNGNGRNQNHNQFTRMTKVEFPKFSGDDVKGWIFRCEQFLSIDEILENQKRFGTVFDDPLSEIRKVKYQTNAKEYQDAFDTLLSRVDISEEHAVSFYLGGLPAEIEMGDETFVTDMMILPLGGCEMVLGIQWLATLGDIKCNFNQLKMEFPLTQLLKKNAFKLSLEPKDSFEELKRAMIKAPVLGLPDFNEPFIIETDASEVGLGVVLQQKGHPIAYLNHFSLKYLLDQRITTPTQMKWLPKLMEYDYEMVYKKGSDNGTADALSRLENASELLSMFVSSITTDLMQRVKSAWATETAVLYIITTLHLGQPAKKHYCWANDTLLRNGKIVVGQDSNLKTKLLQYFHESTIGGHSRVKVFLDSIYKLHGLPESIISDRDKVFISAFWKELFKVLKVKLLMSTAYHPQTDGQIDVVNRCLKGHLRCMTGKHLREWSKWLPLAELWYNTNFHTSINTTPFELVYGQTLPIYVPYMGD
nr:hypothetical protein [Tanacetum cinerariifolium]